MKLLLVREALKIVEGTRVRSFIAELNRHKGELLLRQGHPEAVDESLDEARRILGVDVVQGFGDKQQLETVMTGDVGHVVILSPRFGSL